MFVKIFWMMVADVVRWKYIATGAPTLIFNESANVNPLIRGLTIRPDARGVANDLPPFAPSAVENKFVPTWVKFPKSVASTTVETLLATPHLFKHSTKASGSPGCRKCQARACAAILCGAAAVLHKGGMLDM